MVFCNITDKMSAFNEHQFEKKLLTLKDSQDSIQTLSAWCLQHRQHHKKIVSTWLKVLRKVKPDQRLTLFYLANDVIQYSKRKNYEYVQTYAPFLQKATTLVRDNKVKQSILRIFKIWDERGVYDETFLSDLTGLLSTSTRSQTTESVQINDFQPRILIEKIKSCKECEDETDLLLKKLNDSHLSLSDADALRASLKDRRQGDDVVSEVDEGVAKMEAYVRALEIELKERSVLIELLDQGSAFYDVQKGEAKVVANAYKNFGGRVKNLKRRLDELIPNLKDCSPVPSPDVNAPSPSPDSDIELPEEAEPIPGLVNQTSSSSFDAVVADHQPVKSHTRGDLPHSLDNRLTSFMGNNIPFDFKKSIFNETSTDTPRSPSPTPLLESGENDLSAGEPVLSSAPDEGKPIEVISSRAEEQGNFSLSYFIKSLNRGLFEPFLQTDSSSSAIPGLSLGNTGSTSNLSPSLKAIVGSTSPLFSSPPGVFENSSGQFNYQKPVPAPVTQSQSVNPEPLPPPPPLPPGLFVSEDGDWSNRDGGLQLPSPGEWNTKLPPKFPTWGDPSPATAWDSAGGTGRKTPTKVDWFSSSLLGKSPGKGQGSKVMESIEETPESPPTYEKEGFSDPVEYDDTEVPELGTGADVDHRTLVPIAPNNRLREAKDIDHRNLISLTGSPAPNFQPLIAAGSQWSQTDTKTSDQDYRNVSPINMKSSLGIPTPPRDKDMEADCDYRIPVPPPIPSKLLEATKRDESHDNIESVDMEMSDDEDNADPISKEQITKSEDKESSVRGQDKRSVPSKLINKPNLKAQEEEQHLQEGFFSEKQKEEAESFDSAFPPVMLQKIPTISSSDRMFRPRTPISQTFHPPVVRQTFDSHFPAMPPVPPSAHMFRMPPHDLGKPPPPIMSLTQPLLLQQKPPPPPPPPPPLPPLLTLPLQKAGVNDRDSNPVQSVPSLGRNITTSLSHPSVPSKFQSELKSSPLLSQSNSVKDGSMGMKWENSEMMEKDGLWVGGFGEQANGSFKNTHNEDMNKSVNESESFGQGSSSEIVPNDFKTGGTLRIRSLMEINTKDPHPYTGGNADENDTKEIGSENVSVIPNTSRTLPDNDSVGQPMNVSEDKGISNINIVCAVNEGMNKESTDGVEEQLVEQAEAEQDSLNSSLDTSNVSDFSRDEIHDAFFNPSPPFPPPGLGFTVPPPQRGRGRGAFRSGGPIRFGIPPILPRFFRPPPLFPPMRQPISPDVQFVGRGPRSPFRPFRGAQGHFGGRW